MCGLLAGSGNIKKGILVALGCFNADRGKDSAGIGWYDEADKLGRAFKIAAHPHVAFPISLSEGIDKAVAARVAIGHTRQATTGVVNSANAHPFVDDGIVFAHNGMISNYQQFGEYQVDSQSLIHGIKKRDFSEYQGSIALVWIENGLLHAYRNGNPLFRGYLEGAMYLASDDDYLKEVGCSKVRELSEGHIYTIRESRIYDCVRVKGSKSYTGAIGYKPNYSGRVYGGQGGSYTQYGWGDDYDARDYYSAPERQKPEPLAGVQCSSCGHMGKSHSQASATTGEWVCYERCEELKDSFSVTCRCMAFKSPPIKLLGVPDCTCKHGFNLHDTVAKNRYCKQPSCPCIRYAPNWKSLRKKGDSGGSTQPPATPEASEGIIDIEKQPDGETSSENNQPEQGIARSALCECMHPFEHHPGGVARECYVDKCRCVGFWPLNVEECGDDIPPDDETTQAVKRSLGISDMGGMC